jgi:hypothetical protein
MENIDDPSKWIEIAKEAITCYDQYFNKKKKRWNEVIFPLFIINCSAIYLIKFPDEIDVIGTMDAGNKLRRLFIDLILREAESYNLRAIQDHDNAVFFDEHNRLENSLKNVAELINGFGETNSESVLKTIAYNVYDEPMIIDFEEEKHHEDYSQALNLGSKIATALVFIDTLLKNEEKKKKFTELFGTRQKRGAVDEIIEPLDDLPF